jgi:hypothetical protein
MAIGGGEICTVMPGTLSPGPSMGEGINLDCACMATATSITIAIIHTLSRFIVYSPRNDSLAAWMGG